MALLALGAAAKNLRRESINRSNSIVKDIAARSVTSVVIAPLGAGPYTDSRSRMTSFRLSRLGG
jgi:hypothetical protein